MALCFHILAQLLLVVGWCVHGGAAAALGTFGFDIHHRYSDTVKNILGLDGLPEKDTLDYYKVMVHRDHLLRGRRLAGDNDTTPLTFLLGNTTIQISDLGFLHYAFVHVGTPSKPFLVALDTGSDLFWLPCECTACARNFTFRSGNSLNFNIYSRNASTTSSVVSCNSTMCGARNQCLTGLNACAYRAAYVSANTSSTGILIEDLLHLATDDDRNTAVDAQITLGCGMIQTGVFLSRGAPNGLFGLGMENISVPSILANKGLTANSFSMCFGIDGIGRIEFGDTGTYAKGVTTFNLESLHQSYNVSITQVAAGENSANLTLTALFDTGTSFTILQDPSYTTIAETFDSGVQDPRHQNDSEIPFEYCYKLNSTARGPVAPKASSLTLTMKGGDKFNVSDPLLLFNIQGVGYVYCLAIIKSSNISIIGQNFMTGHRLVFDREKMVLGWKESDCYNIETSEPGSRTSPPPSPSPPTLPPPTGTENSTEAFPTGSPPGFTTGNSTDSPRNDNSASSTSFTGIFLIVLFSVFGHYFINLSS